jgi:hypothetical protein
MIACPGTGDTEEPQSLAVVDLLVDRFDHVEVADLRLPAELELAAAGGPPQHLHAAVSIPGRLLMPDTITTGNSRPFAAWIVVIRSESMSVSG